MLEARSGTEPELKPERSPEWKRKTGPKRRPTRAYPTLSPLLAILIIRACYHYAMLRRVQPPICSIYFFIMCLAREKPRHRTLSNFQPDLRTCLPAKLFKRKLLTSCITGRRNLITRGFLRNHLSTNNITESEDYKLQIVGLQIKNFYNFTSFSYFIIKLVACKIFLILIST